MELVPTCLAFAAATVFRRLPTGRGIDRVADFLRAGGGGLNVELGFQPGLFHQVLHHELSHVSAADKEDFYYHSHTPKPYFCQYSTLPA